MAEIEGGWDGACWERFSGGEEGGFIDRHIHHEPWIFSKQGNLYHQEDGAYHRRRPRRRDFLFGETSPWLLISFSSGPTRVGGRQVHRKGTRRDPPDHPPFRQSWDHCDRGWHCHDPSWGDSSWWRQRPWPLECHAVWWCLAYLHITQLWISWHLSLASEWGLPCWEDQSKDESDPKDTAHVPPWLLHEVVLHGVN